MPRDRGERCFPWSEALFHPLVHPLVHPPVHPPVRCVGMIDQEIESKRLPGKTPSALPNVRFRKGKWRIQVFSHRTADGTKCYEYGSLDAPDNAVGKKQAQKKAFELREKVEQRRGRLAVNSTRAERTLGMVLDDYAAWAESKERTRRGREGAASPASLKTMESNIRRIKEWSHNAGDDQLGELLAIDLEPEVIEAMYKELRIYLKSPSIARLHSTLHAALERARKQRWIDRNPAADVLDKPSQYTGKIELPSKDEMRALLAEASQSPPMLCWVMLAISFGARRGTLGALRWSDFHFDQGLVTFERALSDGGKRRRGVEVKGPKADNPYTATLMRHEVEQLQKLRRLQKLTVGPEWTEEHYVFSRDGGFAFLHPSTATHDFMKLRDRAGVKINLHKLKHYGVTQLLLRGRPVLEVAFRTGTTPETIQRRYAQWVNGADRESANEMEALMDELLPVSGVDNVRQLA